MWSPVKLPELAEFFKRRQPSQRALCPHTPVPSSATEPKQAGHPTPKHRAQRGRCTFVWQILPEFPGPKVTAQRQAWMFLVWEGLSRDTEVSKKGVSR